MGFVLRVLLRRLRLTGRSRQDLILENLALRHQIAVLERTARDRRCAIGTGGVGPCGVRNGLGGARIARSCSRRRSGAGTGWPGAATGAGSVAAGGRGARVAIRRPRPSARRSRVRTHAGGWVIMHLTRISAAATLLVEGISRCQRCGPAPS